MTAQNKTPQEIVAEVLGISIDLLNDSSGYGNTPNWDSINQVVIINELEKVYGVEIPDLEIERYVTLKAIVDFCNNLNNI